MAEISRIQGPSGPPEKGRISRKPEAGKFKEEMQRIDEVSKIDPDEPKKRKRPEETLLEEELSRAAHSEVEKKPESEKAASFKIPSSEREEALSGKKTISGLPITSEDTQAIEESTASVREAEHIEHVRTTISEITERSAEGQKIKTREAEIAEGMAMPAAPEATEEAKRQGITGASVTPMITPTTPTAPTEPTKVEKPQPEEQILFPEEPPPAYTHLHPDILDVFEHLVGALIYLDQAGIKETTITISSAEDKPSIFNGAQITIREYSTAPKQFNIELSGTPKAVDLFRDNMQDLKQALDTIPYAFKVNTIETSLQ